MTPQRMLPGELHAVGLWLLLLHNASTAQSRRWDDYKQKIVCTSFSDLKFIAAMPLLITYASLAANSRAVRCGNMVAAILVCRGRNSMTVCVC